jgi:hypothetical protein
MTTELRSSVARTLCLCAYVPLCLLLNLTSALAGELPPNQWTPVNEPPAGVQLLGWDEIRYCPDLDGVIFYGAYRSFTSENQNALWLYRFKENRWRLLHVNMFVNRDEQASDGGHTSGKMFYDETRRVLVYGGLVSMSRNDRARTWVFDPRALVGWDANPPAPAPGIAYDGASTYVPELKGAFQGPAWFYDANANRWSQLAKGGGGPPATTDVVYDAKRKRVLAFGGSQGHYGGKPWKTFNDLWTFDLAAKTWSKLEAKNPPPTRGWPQMAISTAADAMLLCNGFSGTQDKNGNAEQRGDTWVLNLETLEWSELEGAKPPHTSYSNHLAYDPTNDVFLMVSGKTTKNLGYGYQCCMYALKYQGKNPAAKLEPPKIEPPPVYDFKALPKPEGEWAALGAGPVSAVGGWAFRPALASSGKELLLAFGEYQPPNKNQDDLCDVYAFKYSGGQWTRLGKRAVSDAGTHSQAPAAAFDAAGRPVVAYQAIKPWVPAAILIKRFDAEWKPAGALETGNTLPALPVLVGGDKPLAAAWQHHPGFLKGIGTFVAEAAAEDKWTPAAGGKALNVGDPTTTRGQYPALARDGQGRLVVAWSEQKAGYEGDGATPERVHVRRLEDGKWAELAGELPAASPQSRHLGHALAIHDGEPALALCEGTDGGRAALTVYAWKGGQWTKLGEPLNVLGPEGGALKPAMVSDGKSLFVAWPEFLPGRAPLLFVKKWDGAKWTLAGGPLNEAPGKGSVHNPAMALLDGKPVVAWTEHDPSGDRLRQVLVKVLK